MEKAESVTSTNVKRFRSTTATADFATNNNHRIQKPRWFFGKIYKKQARRTPPAKQILKKTIQIESSSSDNWLPPLSEVAESAMSTNAPAAADSSPDDEAESTKLIQKPRLFFGKIYKKQARRNLPAKQILKRANQIFPDSDQFRDGYDIKSHEFSGEEGWQFLDQIQRRMDEGGDSCNGIS